VRDGAGWRFDTAAGREELFNRRIGRNELWTLTALHEIVDAQRDYLDGDGLLTGGFAVVAWPAKYGNSGVMSFITNHRGLVYQKDLGPETEQAAAASRPTTRMPAGRPPATS
jgi:hypothetical protein